MSFRHAVLFTKHGTFGWLLTLCDANFLEVVDERRTDVFEGLDY
ncbi:MULTISPECIES: hypothetical protein [Rhizobium/Agrobacterium group]|nr:MULTISPECIES: hypothetical protein [Rhizobium/Agrobacterium group]